MGWGKDRETSKTQNSAFCPLGKLVLVTPFLWDLWWLLSEMCLQYSTQFVDHKWKKPEDPWHGSLQPNKKIEARLSFFHQPDKVPEPEVFKVHLELSAQTWPQGHPCWSSGQTTVSIHGYLTNTVVSPLLGPSQHWFQDHHPRPVCLTEPTLLRLLSSRCADCLCGGFTPATWPGVLVTLLKKQNS